MKAQSGAQCIVTRLQAGQLGFDSQDGRDVSLCQDQLWGPPSLLSSGRWG